MRPGERVGPQSSAESHKGKPFRAYAYQPLQKLCFLNHCFLLICQVVHLIPVPKRETSF